MAGIGLSREWGAWASSDIRMSVSPIICANPTHRRTQAEEHIASKQHSLFRQPDDSVTHLMAGSDMEDVYLQIIKNDFHAVVE